MHPLDNATIQTVTAPPPCATLDDVQMKLLTKRSADDALPRGPFKLLTGGEPINFRPLSGVAIAHRYECRGDLDQLHRIELDADVGALDRDEQPCGTLLDRVLRRLDSYGTGIDYAPTIAALLAAHADKLQAGLDRGKRAHDEPVRLTLSHAPNADIAVMHTNGRQPTFWNQTKHFVRSLIALRWSREASNDARLGREGQ